MRRRLALAAAAILTTTPIVALDMPQRKAGLWELKMVMEGRNFPPQVSQHCIDAETDKIMNSIGGGGRDMCSKQDMRRAGSVMIVDSVCKVGTMTTTSHAEITGSFDSAYTIKLSSRHDGAPPAMTQANPGGQSNMTIEAKWLGACKPDQKPGDMIAANGVKINIRDMQGMPAQRR